MNHEFSQPNADTTNFHADRDLYLRESVLDELKNLIKQFENKEIEGDVAQAELRRIINNFNLAKQTDANTGKSPDYKSNRDLYLLSSAKDDLGFISEKYRTKKASLEVARYELGRIANLLETKIQPSSDIILNFSQKLRTIAEKNDDNIEEDILKALHEFPEFEQ